MSGVSPELELFDSLCGGKLSLWECANHIGFRDIEHTRRTLFHYIKEGLVEMYDRTTPPWTKPIPDYNARHILANEKNWSKTAPYRIAGTDKGFRRYANDAEGLFDELFKDN